MVNNHGTVRSEVFYQFYSEKFYVLLFVHGKSGHESENSDSKSTFTPLINDKVVFVNVWVRYSMLHICVLYHSYHCEIYESIFRKKYSNASFNLEIFLVVISKIYGRIFYLFPINTKPISFKLFQNSMWAVRKP